MKNIIGFVGVGQAGSNIVGALKKQGFENIGVINSSTYDLNHSNLEISRQLLLGEEEGCAKDRNIAKKIMQDNYKIAVKWIKENFQNVNIIYFVFAAGGGTGSGMTPAMIKILEKSDLNKKFGAIIIYPSFKEDIQSMLNSIESVSELYSLDIPCLNIDNNSKGDRIDELEYINNKIAKYFSDFSEEKNSEFGTIDIQEKIKTLTTPGSLIFAGGKNFKLENISQMMKEQVLNGCFIKPEDDIVNISSCMIGVTDKTFIKNIDLFSIKNLIGEPVKNFQSFYFSKQNECLAVYSGMNYPYKRIEKMKEKVQIFKEKYKQVEKFKIEGIDSSIFEVKRNSKKTEIEDEEIDIMNLF